MKIDKREVGRKIKKIRLNKGLSMEKFGELFNTSKGNVSTWESGNSLPNNQRIKEIAEIGNITVEYILTGKTSITVKDFIDFLASIEGSKLANEINNYSLIETLSIIENFKKED